MAIIPNTLTLEHTVSNDGHLINHAYHDFVVSIFGYQNYAQQYLGLTNFKYILTVYSDVDGKLLQLKSPRNSLGYGLFNLRTIFEDITATDESGYAMKRKSGALVQSTSNQVGFSVRPHSVHEIDKFCRNKRNLRRVYFSISGEFFHEGTQYTINTAFPKLTTKGNLLPFYLLWNACLSHADGDENNKFNQYILTSLTKKFLTDKRTDCVRSVRNYDYETLAFFNGVFQIQVGGHGTGGFNPQYISNVADIYIEAHGTNAFNMVIPNTTANGGSETPIFQTNYNTPQYPAYTDEGLLYVGVGPRNIADNGLTDTGGNPVTQATFNGITHYTAHARSSNGTQISEKIRFDVIPHNCKYESIRIAYLNRKGAYDYFNFIKKSVNITEITRSNFKKNYGYLPLQVSNNVNDQNKWDYGSYGGGTRSYNVNAIETIECNSDFMNEADALALQELFTSPVCYIQRGGQFEPCVVTEKDYTIQTTDNDKLKQYVVKIQLGHEQRVQRL